MNFKQLETELNLAIIAKKKRFSSADTTINIEQSEPRVITGADPGGGPRGPGPPP